VTADLPWRSIRAACRGIVRARVDLAVEGVEHLPAHGPVIIAARHYHHLYDGCALLTAIERPAHIVVGLDWVRNRVGLAAMTAACRAAEWPIVFRDGATAPRTRLAALRRSLRGSLAILRRGHVLIMFPEGYPTIDPHPTPKAGPNDFLPFQSGFARMAVAAAAEGLRVPIVPAGFSYRQRSRWEAALRFGEPVEVASPRDRERAVRMVEERVWALSGHAADAPPDEASPA
jgi:putative membrane protein